MTETALAIKEDMTLTVNDVKKYHQRPCIGDKGD
jgi:hypothetical protein